VAGRRARSPRARAGRPRSGGPAGRRRGCRARPGRARAARSAAPPPGARPDARTAAAARRARGRRDPCAGSARPARAGAGRGPPSSIASGSSSTTVRAGQVLPGRDERLGNEAQQVRGLVARQEAPRDLLLEGAGGRRVEALRQAARAGAPSPSAARTRPRAA
jgi:hypothetical protein